MENYPADDLPTVTSLIPLILREIVRWGRLSTMPRVLSLSWPSLLPQSCGSSTKSTLGSRHPASTLPLEPTLPTLP